MPAVHFRSARQLATDIRKKKIGCLELLDLYLARVEKYNPALNAIVVKDVDRARRRARAADRALAKGEPWGPLHGVPMTIKESYDVAGLPTTWGVPAFRNNVATRNAVAVDRFVGAGALLFGKTNVPLYLADWQAFNVIYGTTNNPWDLARSPGGSSGGSAAALAAGLTALEAGSDIGSSIRNPAHFCGVYGHKPTWGIVPRHGQALPGQVAPVDIDVVGPMARSTEDLELALSVMAGPDDIDGAGWQLRLRPPAKKRLRDYKVALMLDADCSEVDREVQARLQALGDFLRQQRAKVNDRARPAIDTRDAFRTYLRLLRGATSGRQSDAEFQKALETSRALLPGDESYFAQMTRAHTMPHRDWLAANEARHRMRLAWAEFFREYDLLLCPAAGTAAIPHDQKGERYERTNVINGKRLPVTDHLFWAGYTGAFFLPSTRRALRLHAGRAARRRPDRRTAVRRPHLSRVREAAGARVPGVRAASRLRLGGVIPKTLHSYLHERLPESMWASRLTRGTSDADMKLIAIENGKPADMGGNRIDELGAAARGVVIALEVLLEHHEISAMPVVDGRAVLGMVSADRLARRSLLRLLQSLRD